MWGNRSTPLPLSLPVFLGCLDWDLPAPFHPKRIQGPQVVAHTGQKFPVVSALNKAEQNGSCQKRVYLHQKHHLLHRPRAPWGPETASWIGQSAWGSGRGFQLQPGPAQKQPLQSQLLHCPRGGFLPRLPKPWGGQLPPRPWEGSFIHMNRLQESFELCIPGGVVLTTEKEFFWKGTADLVGSKQISLKGWVQWIPF